MAEDYPDYTLPVVHVGAITVEGSVSVLGTVEVKGAVTVSGTVSIEGTVTVKGAVTVSGTVSIEGTVTVTGSVTVSGTVSITGTVEVTGSVTVSGAVTIGTIAADNIIIDKLTVGAYTERRSTLSNHGETFAWYDETGNDRWGKFFPRGCRGFIHTIDVWCKDSGDAGGTITVYISPHPSMGYVATATVTVPAEGAEDWRSATFNRMWNYDSLFIFVVCSSAYIKFGYDSGEPYDRFLSGDAGASWEAKSHRGWFRVVMEGETCGDVPVSGVVNTIEIPSQSQERLFNQISVGTTETTLKEVFGAGKTEYVVLRVAVGTDSHLARMRIYCDGNLSFDWTYSALNIYSYAASTPGISLTLYGTDVACVVHLTIRFSFLRHLKVTFQNVTSAKTSTVDGLVNLMK